MRDGRGNAARPAPTWMPRRAPAEWRGLGLPWECARMGSATSRSCVRGRRAMRADMHLRGPPTHRGQRPSGERPRAALRRPLRWPAPRPRREEWCGPSHRAKQGERAPRAQVLRLSQLTRCVSVHLAGFACEAHSDHRAPDFRSAGAAEAGRSPRTAPPDQSSMRKSICGLRGFAPRVHACTAEGHADNVSATMAFVSRRRTRYERKTSLQLRWFIR